MARPKLGPLRTSRGSQPPPLGRAASGAPQFEGRECPPAARLNRRAAFSRHRPRCAWDDFRFSEDEDHDASSAEDALSLSEGGRWARFLLLFKTGENAFSFSLGPR